MPKVTHKLKLTKKKEYMNLHIFIIYNVYLQNTFYISIIIFI